MDIDKKAVGICALILVVGVISGMMARPRIDAWKAKKAAKKKSEDAKKETK